MTDHHMYFHILIQWLNFLGIVLLVGGVVFRWAVLERSLGVLDRGSPEQGALEATGHRDLRRLIGGCLILLVIVSVLDLILRAQMMSGKPLSQLLEILPAVLFQTHVGKTWLAKMAILCLFGVLWFFMKETVIPSQQPLLLLASAGLCLMVSLGGHAADKGNLSLSILADWLHVMAISSWVGGLFPLRFLLPRLLAPMDEKDQLKLETAVIHHFSRLAVRCVSILIVTGAYNVWLHVPILKTLVTTPYGITLLLKLVLVALMLGLGALSRYYILPGLQMLLGQAQHKGLIGRLVNRGIRLLGGKTGIADSPVLQRRFQIFIALECIFALGVLGLTALLTQTSPPHVTGFTSPDNISDMHKMEM